MNRRAQRTGEIGGRRLASTTVIPLVLVLELIGNSLARCEPLQDGGRRETFDGNGLDFVLFVSTNRPFELSLDPEVVSCLTGIQVHAELTAGASGLAWLEGQLRPHGFMVVLVPLSPSKKVAFLTRRENAFYCAALAHLKRGDAQSASALFARQAFDSTEFGDHCRELSETLAAVLRSRRRTAALTSSVEGSVQRWRVARAGEATARSAAQSGIARPASVKTMGASLAVSYAQSCASHAAEEERSSQASVASLARELSSVNQLLGQRFRRAYDSHLGSEAVFWFGCAVENHRRESEILAWLRCEGVAVDLPPSPAREEAITAVRAHLLRLVQVADARASAGAASLDAGDKARASSLFSQAFVIDRANPWARVGTGYCLLQEYVRAPRARFEYLSRKPIKPPPGDPAPSTAQAFDIRLADPIFDPEPATASPVFRMALGY